MYLRLRHSQQGSLMILSVFVLIIMLLLGLALNRVLTAASDAVVYEVYGLRALNAARSGIEMSVGMVFPLDNSAAVCGSVASDTSLFNQVQGQENCQFNAQCSVINFADGLSYYQFTSVGSCDVQGITVSRRLSIDARTGGI